MTTTHWTDVTLTDGDTEIRGSNPSASPLLKQLQAEDAICDWYVCSRAELRAHDADSNTEPGLRRADVDWSGF